VRVVGAGGWVGEMCIYMILDRKVMMINVGFLTKLVFGGTKEEEANTKE